MKFSTNGIAIVWTGQEWVNSKAQEILHILRKTQTKKPTAIKLYRAKESKKKCKQGN